MAFLWCGLCASMHSWCHTRWNERRYAVEWMEFPSGRNGHNRSIDCECQHVFPCGELTKVQVIQGNLCLQNWIQILTRDALDIPFDYIIQQHCAMSTVVLSLQSCPENARVWWCYPRLWAMLRIFSVLSWAEEMACWCYGTSTLAKRSVSWVTSIAKVRH